MFYRFETPRPGGYNQDMAKKKIFIYSDDMERFPYPPQCPFNTSRAGKTRDIIDSMGLLDGQGAVEFAPRQAEADRKTLEALHSGEYLDTLQKASSGQFDYDMLSVGIGTGDCPVSKNRCGPGKF